MMSSIRKYGLRLLLPAVILAAWYLLTANSTSVYFPPLSKILDAFVHTWFFDLFTTDLLYSVSHLVIGFFIAVVVGIGAGVLLGLSPRLSRDVTPMVEFARCKPMV